MTNQTWPPHWLPKITRDLVLLCAGLGGVMHEAYRAGPERPQLLLLYAAWTGLPLVLRSSELRQNDKAGENKSNRREP